MQKKIIPFGSYRHARSGEQKKQKKVIPFGSIASRGVGVEQKLPALPRLFSVSSVSLW
jgi:hypothetical protein